MDHLVHREFINKRSITITPNEQFWLEVIRQASRDRDPPPTLERVRRVRAIFREPG